MAQKAAAETLNEIPFDHSKSASIWGFRRRPAVSEAVSAQTAAGEPEFEPDTLPQGFEPFGRCGLQLGGLDRDRQWVGSWSGRC